MGTTAGTSLRAVVIVIGVVVAIKGGGHPDAVQFKVCKHKFILSFFVTSNQNPLVAQGRGFAALTNAGSTSEMMFKNYAKNVQNHHTAWIIQFIESRPRSHVCVLWSSELAVLLYSSCGFGDTGIGVIARCCISPESVWFTPQR